MVHSLKCWGSTIEQNVHYWDVGELCMKSIELKPGDMSLSCELNADILSTLCMEKSLFVPVSLLLNLQVEYNF